MTSLEMSASVDEASSPTAVKTAGMAGQNTLLSISAAGVGAISYACTLLMAHALPGSTFTDYAATQSLLTTVGVAASALVPLPLAHAVRAHGRKSEQRRRAMAFAVLVSVLCGVIAAGALCGLGLLFATPGVAEAAGLSGFALFVIAPVWGWWQGETRFASYAAVSLAEVALRFLFSVAAVVLGWGVVGAVGAFAAGAMVVLALGLRSVLGDLAWRPQVLTERVRWSETGGVAAVQLALSGLVGADVVLLALVAVDSPNVAGYQALATLAKAPVYVAAGTALVSFPLLRNASGVRMRDIIATATGSFAWLALPATAVVATVPPALVQLVLPRYVASLPLLPWLAAAGLGYGAMTVLAIVLLATRAYGRLVVGLLSAVTLVGTGLAAGWSIDATHGLAVGTALGAVTAAAVFLVVTAPFLSAITGRQLAHPVVFSAALLAAMMLLRSFPVLWMVVALCGAFAVLRATRRQRVVQPLGAGRHEDSTVRSHDESTTAHLRIVHLGFEDHRAPGAGGGSRRTHEINRRLAQAGHHVVVLTTRYPGCAPRYDEGVHYRQVGIGQGRTRLTRLLGYVLRLPGAVRGTDCDLVVEDFFAPISSMSFPCWTSRPVVGVVQWLNARDKARQYKLPFHVVEHLGVRSHRQLIAVSAGIADRLRAINPQAAVEIVGNGVESAAFEPAAELGCDVLFLGRLEIAQKGLDLLLRAWARTDPQRVGTLLIAGTGPDERRLKHLVSTLGITERVRFLGWVDGAAKYRLIASARLMVIPSRFETFGIVAIEALAAATPVLAFDIPCLKEVVPPDSGWLVPAFDTDAFADVVTTVYSDTQAITRAGAAGRHFAASYDWDTLARQQEQAYFTALGIAAPGGPAQVARTSS